MIARLRWKLDMLVYRLFFWCWNPRLKADPNLAYVFAVFMQGWTNTNPPEDRAAIDKWMYETFQSSKSIPYSDDPNLGVKVFIKAKPTQ